MTEPMSVEAMESAISDQKCKKIEIEGFARSKYYCDIDGHVYSLRDKRNPRHIPTNVRSDGVSVTLFNDNSTPQVVLVGEIMAYTWLTTTHEDEELHAPVYRDGNIQNNHRDNIEWGSLSLARSQLESARNGDHMKLETRDEKAVVDTKTGTSTMPDKNQSAIPFVKSHTDPAEPPHFSELPRLAQQLLRTWESDKKRTDALQARCEQLTEALRAFDDFTAKDSDNEELRRAIENARRVALESSTNIQETV